MINKSASLHSTQHEETYSSAYHYFNDLVQAIDQACSSIIMDYYIFSNDPLGQKVINALIQASRRNIRIQLLIDGIGSFESSSKITQQLTLAGIEIKIFHPLPWQLALYSHSLSTGGPLYKLLRFTQRINHRDHRKICLIDNNELWTGSFNISQKHLPINDGGENWRDYGVKVTGGSVKNIRADFESQWDQRNKPSFKRLFRYYWHSINAITRLRKNTLLVNKIHDATHKVWIVSAYFAPSSKVLRALKHAAKQNTDIKVIVPRLSDIRFFPNLTRTYYAELLKHGIEVYEYLPGILHAKALIIDDTYIIGSTNFNHRSFLHDLELDIILTNNDAKKSLEQYLLEDFNASEKINPNQMNRPLLSRLSGWLSRLLRYWM